MELTTAQKAQTFTARNKLSEKKKQVFLTHLAETGRVLASAQRAGYADTSFLNRQRRDNEEFDKAWTAAEDAGSEALLAEATRRAVDGVQEDVYYKGEVVGQKTNYSDSMLMFLIKGKRPEFRDRAQADVKIDANLGIAFLPTPTRSADEWEQQAIQVHDEQKSALPSPINSDTEIIDLEVEQDDDGLAEMLGEEIPTIRRG